MPGLRQKVLMRDLWKNPINDVILMYAWSGELINLHIGKVVVIRVMTEIEGRLQK